MKPSVAVCSTLLLAFVGIDGLRVAPGDLDSSIGSHGSVQVTSNGSGGPVGVPRAGGCSLIPVTTTVDEFGTGANCSLREALEAANSNVAFGGCIAGEAAPRIDTVKLGPGHYNLTFDNWLERQSGDLDINESVTVHGDPANPASTIIDASPIDDSVFEVEAESGGTVTLRGLTITGGNAVLGGGINNGADHLVVESSIIRENSASWGGGGINSSNPGAMLIVRNSLITSNHAIGTDAGKGFAGGILLDNGAAKIINTTISKNTANDDGGGIRNNSGALTLVNVTITQNTADNDHVIPSGGYAGSGGGIFAPFDTPLEVRNSIIAFNHRGTVSNTSNCFFDLQSHHSSGYNVENANSCQFTATGDLANSTHLLLSSTASDNGGPTPTHAVSSGSDAIDRVAKAACTDLDGRLLTVDQRGSARPIDADGVIGARCDSGAFELEVCGDAVLGVNEVCDPGTLGTHDCCGSDCRSLEASGTACENSTNTPGYCDNAGTCNVCGDGVVGVNEDCDVGADLALDCCDASCKYRAVDSVCDDGNGDTTQDVCDGAGNCVGSTTEPPVPSEPPSEPPPEPPVPPAPGSLDSSFGFNGILKLTSNGSGELDWGSDVLVQEDGRILALGLGGGCLVLMRRNADGLEDVSFNVGDTPGKVKVCSPAGLMVQALAQQSDGKILVVGSLNRQLTVWRFSKDGVLDASFNRDGPSPGSYTLGGLPVSLGRDIAVQNDGKILVVGDESPAEKMGILVRLNSDGIPDPSFLGGGVVKIPPQEDAAFDYFQALVLQPDGKYVVGNSLLNWESYTGLVYRFDSDGSLDSDFGLDGYSQPDEENKISIYDVALQPDGKLLYSGIWYDKANQFSKIYLGRLNPDGSRDEDFGLGGFTTAPWGESSFGIRIALLEDGKTLVLGNPTILVFRVTKDGWVDDSFGNGGSAQVPLEYGNSLDVQPDGKIIVIGTKDGDIALARLAGNSADLEIGAQVDDPALREGAEVNLQVTVTNKGPHDSGMVFLTRDLPDSFKVLEVVTRRGTCDFEHEKKCPLGVLSASESTKVKIRAQFLGGDLDPNEVPVATVHGGQVFETDPGDNTAQVLLSFSDQDDGGTTSTLVPSGAPRAAGCSLIVDTPY